MPLEYAFRCPLPNGLHARPASYLAEVAERFKAVITLRNERTETCADAASVLELVGAGVLQDDPCRITVTGTDQDDAFKAIVAFITNELPDCDTPLPAVAPSAAARVPRVLEAEQITCIAGTAVSPGIGWGQIVTISGLKLPAELQQQRPGPAAEEQQALGTALEFAAAGIESLEARTSQTTEAEVLRANLAIVRDRAFTGLLLELAGDGKHTASQAVVEAVERFSTKLAATGSAYLRERAVDLQDIGAQLLERLTGGAVSQQQAVLDGPSIVVAPNLAPRQLLSLDRTQLKGLILTEAGTTSHAVILARSFGIPTVTGIANAAVLLPGQEVVLDANRGLVISPFAPVVKRFYAREQAKEQAYQQRFAASIHNPAQSKDGVRLAVAANIATSLEAEAAVQNGAEGVGLFRTEMILSGRDTPPSEEEQYAIYAETLQALDGRSLIIRTYDIGGDKPLPFLSLSLEDNPFLGYRGIRLYPAFPELIDTQLRAVCRSSALGPVRVMAPMVGTLQEAQWLKERIRSIQAALKEQGLPFDPAMPVGIMVEVPSAALIMDQLSAAVDFFSIGTNDLCQYLMAVDRGNKQVAELYNERQAAFLRVLQLIVEGAHGAGRCVGLCGEMARHVDNLPLLLGLGIDEISMSAPAIPAVKTALAGLDAARCRELVARALNCETSAEISSLLAEMRAAGAAAPLLAPELIVLDSNSATKAEAIKELTDLLYIAGRSTAPELVEDAVWAREAVYSTGLGYGFAIPHCKCSALQASSLCLLKLQQPIAWGSLDGAPVSCVILLAMRESEQGNAHLRVFSKLARKLMSEEFRAALLAQSAAGPLLAYLAQKLEISLEEE